VFRTFISRYVNVGLSYLRQVFFAKFDIKVHTSSGTRPLMLLIAITELFLRGRGLYRPLELASRVYLVGQIREAHPWPRCVRLPKRNAQQFMHSPQAPSGILLEVMMLGIMATRTFAVHTSRKFSSQIPNLCRLATYSLVFAADMYGESKISDE